MEQFGSSSAASSSGPHPSKNDFSNQHLPRTDPELRIPRVLQLYTKEITIYGRIYVEHHSRVRKPKQASMIRIARVKWGCRYAVRFKKRHQNLQYPGRISSTPSIRVTQHISPPSLSYPHLPSTFDHFPISELSKYQNSLLYSTSTGFFFSYTSISTTAQPSSSIAESPNTSIRKGSLFRIRLLCGRQVANSVPAECKRERNPNPSGD